MESKNNLELKHRCSDFTPIRQVLAEIGAAKEAVKEQKDWFFVLPAGSPGRLKLRLEDGDATLIYYERPDFDAATPTAAKIALYPVAGGNIVPFLETALGIKAVVEKTREVWRKGHTVFHLDQVKGVGDVFEIELQKTGEPVNGEDRRVFESYRSRLLPHLGAVIAGSNLDLVADAATR